MREVARKTKVTNEKEIIYSRTVKAGKRIYYLDVKQDKRDQLFVSITESKRLEQSDSESFVFEKHKLFIFKEDFGKFHKAMEDIMSFITRAEDLSYTIDKEINLESSRQLGVVQLKDEVSEVEEPTKVSIRFDVDY